MRTQLILTAIAATALLSGASGRAAEASTAGPPPTVSRTVGQPDLATVEPLVDSIKMQYRQAYQALVEQNDPAAAAKALANLVPEVKRMAAALKGTEFEPPVADGLKGLGELRKLLESGETEQAKKMMEELGQRGGELEPKLRALVADANAAPQGQAARLAHVEVTATGISDAYTKAIARTVEAARAVALEQFGFDMPDTIHVSATASPGTATQLFTDGDDHITLTVPSEDKLRPPAESGVFNLYGFCHELSHMAMYRVIHQRAWLSSAGAEGWADFAGSRILDTVYAREGEKLWPEPYNYLADGTARLRKRLASAKPEASVQAAGLWLALAEILGDKGLAPLFAAWAKVQVDESNPGVALGNALMAQGDKEKLGPWWQKAQPVLLVASAKSGFAAKSKEAAQLKGPRKELAKDDGVSAGKLSTAGSGHAVRFEAPGKASYLTAVRIFGSRYGQPQPPRENASIWLCDASFKKIAEFPCPYSFFQRGDAKWVTIPVKPTQVPPEFILCVGFNPTGSKGVYVHYDSAGCGNSFLALPGSKGRAFEKGDWLIRATVQEATE
jgi:hypothetical protein